MTDTNPAELRLDDLRPAGLARAVPDSGPRGEPAEICGDFDLRIARDGTWLYRGTPISRPALVRLFARVLRREDDGGYWLVTPFEKGRLRVDDAPFVAVDFDAEGSGESQALVFRTNLDERVAAGPARPIVVRAAPDGTPAPYVLVRPGLEARIARAPYYRLVEIAVERGGRFGVWSGGAFFALEPAAP
jgi:hypothetical protein